MSCDRYTDAIVDHACGADLADDAAAHLRGCAACRRIFEEQRQVLQGLDSDLQAALAIEPSAWFEAQTLAGLERSPIRRRGTFWWIAVAAAAAVIILGTLVAIRSGDPQPIDRQEAAGRPVAPPTTVVEHVPSSGAPAVATTNSAPVSSGAPRRRERATVAARQQGDPTETRRSDRHDTSAGDRPLSGAGSQGRHRFVSPGGSEHDRDCGTRRPGDCADLGRGSSSQKRGTWNRSRRRVNAGSHKECWR